MTFPPKYTVKLMLDSGAFSAWKSRIEIDWDEYLHEYISYCIENQTYLDTIVNLDVIPGEFGRKPTVTEVEASAEQGYSNLKRMEEHGLSPIPVFHQGERWCWLERLIDEDYTYIGISPANDRSTRAKRDWLDDVFEILPSSIRTHAFGMTQVDLLYRFPFYSCDSMTWFIAASNGGVMVPILATWPRLLLERQPKIVKVTYKSRHHSDHYDKLPYVAQFAFRRYCNYVTSFELRELRANYINRTAANLRICRSYERTLIRHHGGRFGRWIYAVNTTADYNALLSGILKLKGFRPAEDDDWYKSPLDGGYDSDEPGDCYGVPFDFFQPNRLLSYWLIKEANKDKDPDFLRGYVSTGLIEGFELRDKLGNPFQPRFDPRRLPQS